MGFKYYREKWRYRALKEGCIVPVKNFASLANRRKHSASISFVADAPLASSDKYDGLEARDNYFLFLCLSPPVNAGDRVLRQTFSTVSAVVENVRADYTARPGDSARRPTRSISHSK